MKSSPIAQAQATNYHPQTSGIVERQNRTLANMLRVYCSRYMTDWDKKLQQFVGAYNSTQHPTTGISPYVMLTGREVGAYNSTQHPTTGISPYVMLKGNSTDIFLLRIRGAEGR